MAQVTCCLNNGGPPSKS